MAERLQIHLDAIDNTRKAFSAFQTRLDKIKSSVFNLRSALLGVGAGAVVKGFIDAGIQVENLEVQLKALFGSAKAGKDALKIVTDFATKTPFELSNIQQGIVSLATVRKTAEEAGVSFEELLKITGNTAVNLGGDFALASQQIQRAFSGGISASELFRDRGITAMAGFQVGTKYTIDETVKRLRKAFGTGGEFGNLIDELAKTLSGTVSNLKDAFFTFQVAVSAGFFSELKKQLGDLKSFIESNDDAIKKFGVEVGQGLSRAITSLANAGKFVYENFNAFKNVLIAVVGIKILTFFSQFIFLINDLRKAMLTLNVAMLANPLFLGASAVAVIVSGIYAISKSMEDANKNANSLAEGFRALNEEIPMVGQNLFPNIPTAPFKREIVFVQDDSLDLFTEIEGKVQDTESGLQKILKSLKKANDNDLKAFDESWTNIYETIGTGINNGIAGISKGLAESLVLGKSLADTFKQMAQQLLVNIIAKLIEERLIRLANLAIAKASEAWENAKKNRIAEQNSLLRQQIAYASTLSSMGGFSGGGGGFNTGGFGGGGGMGGDSQIGSSIGSTIGYAYGGPVGGAIGSILGSFLPFAEGGSINAGQPAIVGERGREMFIPTTDGQIIRNEDLGMGGNNLTFNINATDVRGIRELLIDNRATITNIINSALNQKGKSALV